VPGTVSGRCRHPASESRREPFVDPGGVEKRAGKLFAGSLLGRNVTPNGSGVRVWRRKGRQSILAHCTAEGGADEGFAGPFRPANRSDEGLGRALRL